MSSLGGTVRLWRGSGFSPTPPPPSTIFTVYFFPPGPGLSVSAHLVSLCPTQPASQAHHPPPSPAPPTPAEDQPPYRQGFVDLGAGRELQEGGAPMWTSCTCRPLQCHAWDSLSERRNPGSCYCGWDLTTAWSLSLEVPVSFLHLHKWPGPPPGRCKKVQL